MSMGYIKFFFKNHMEKLISAMGLNARKTTTRTHDGKTFVPILCHLLTKTGHIRGNVAITKSFYNIDIVILICCSFTLFTHCI